MMGTGGTTVWTTGAEGLAPATARGRELSLVMSPRVLLPCTGATAPGLSMPATTLRAGGAKFSLAIRGAAVPRVEFVFLRNPLKNEFIWREDEGEYESSSCTREMKQSLIKNRWERWALLSCIAL